MYMYVYIYYTEAQLFFSASAQGARGQHERLRGKIFFEEKYNIMRRVYALIQSDREKKKREAIAPV